MAEAINALYKAELYRNPAALAANGGPWKGLDDLEIATCGWVSWFARLPGGRIALAIQYGHLRASTVAEGLTTPAGLARACGRCSTSRPPGPWPTTSKARDRTSAPGHPRLAVERDHGSSELAGELPATSDGIAPVTVLLPPVRGVWQGRTATWRSATSARGPSWIPRPWSARPTTSRSNCPWLQRQPKRRVLTTSPRGSRYSTSKIVQDRFFDSFRCARNLASV